MVQKWLIESAKNYLVYDAMVSIIGDEVRTAPFAEARALYEKALVRARIVLEHHERVLIRSGVSNAQMQKLAKSFRG